MPTDSDEHGDDRPRRAPLQLNNGDRSTTRVVFVWPQIKAAHLTGVGVRLILITITALAVPTARDTLHDFLALASLTGMAADWGRDLTDSTRPLHRTNLRRQRDTKIWRDVKTDEKRFVLSCLYPLNWRWQVVRLYWSQMIRSPGGQRKSRQFGTYSFGFWACA